MFWNILLQYILQKMYFKIYIMIIFQRYFNHKPTIYYDTLNSLNNALTSIYYQQIYSNVFLDKFLMCKHNLKQYTLHINHRSLIQKIQEVDFPPSLNLGYSTHWDFLIKIFCNPLSNGDIEHLILGMYIYK